MSVYNDILKQVLSDVRDLNLDGIADASMIIQKVATDRKQSLPRLPGIIVSPFGSKVSPSTAGTNERDDIEYPVLVATLALSNESQTSDLERETGWHESILSKFINQHLTGVTSVYNCRVDPRDVFDPNAFFAKSLDVGGLVLRFISRETRG
jgi:hypothetical protein